MTHIRMILKHLCLSDILHMIQSEITWFWGYILLHLLCSMSLISPKFDVNLIIFSQFWAGAFSQNCLKKPWMSYPVENKRKNFSFNVTCKFIHFWFNLMSKKDYWPTYLPTFWIVSRVTASKLFIKDAMVLFFIIISNMYSGCSKELSQWDSSFEYPKRMFKLRNKKLWYIFLSKLG